MAPRREIPTLRSADGYDLSAVTDLPACIAAGHGGRRDDSATARLVPGVLFCHGFTGHKMETRRMFARLCARLAAAGIGSFRFDHRGCGESDGGFEDFTPDGMLEDLRTAHESFRNLRGLDRSRMALVGFSLGGASVSYLLSRDPAIATAVLVNPLGRPGTMIDRFRESVPSDHPGLPGGSGGPGAAAAPWDRSPAGNFEYGGFRVSDGFLTDPDWLTPVEWIAGHPAPVLFIHGQADKIVGPEQSEALMKGHSHPMDRREVLPGADHTFSECAHLDRVIDLAEAWLKEMLLRRRR